MLKKILKIFLWIVVSIVGLLLLVSILVFLPPVQNLIKDKAAQIVSNSLGMDLSIGKIRLRFPLTLTVDDATMVTAEGDTLARVGHLKAGVALVPLFAGEVVVNQFLLEDVAADYNDSLSGMRLTGSLGSIKLDGTNAKLKKSTVDVRAIAIERADVDLFLSEGTAPVDTLPDTTAIEWVLGLRRINLDDINFRMHTSPQVSELTAQLSEGELRGLSVDLGTQTISASLLSLEKGEYSYLTDTTTYTAAAEPADSISAAESLPWTISLSRLELSDNAFRYGSLAGTPAPGFDPAHIQLSGIGLRIDSIYNRATDVAAVIRSLEARERSGLEITEAEGRFSMDSAGIRLAGLDLRTTDSRIQANADAGAEILNMAPQTALTANLEAIVGMADVNLLYPLDTAMRRALAGKPLTLRTEIDGTLGSLSIRNLRVQLANNIDLRASGNVRSVTDPQNLSGNLNLNGMFNDLDFVKQLLSDTALRNRIGFPERMTLAGSVSAIGEAYSPDLVLTADSGRLAVNARLDMSAETYTAKLLAENFPLGTFLPQDSLGMLSLSLDADGRIFNPTAEGAMANVNLGVARLDYNGFDFSDITLAATLEDHILKGTLTSTNEALQLDMALNGELRENLYSAALRGNVAKADIEAMGFSATPLAVALQIDASGSANMADTAYKANLVIDSVQVAYGPRIARIGRTTLDAAANRESVTANLASGDLKLDFRSSESITTLADGFSSAASLVMQQIDSLNLDMLPLQEVLPSFRLDFLAGRGNPLRDYLRTTGMDFNRVSITAGSDDNTPFGAAVVVNGFRTGGLTLDTLNVWMQRRNEKLGYAVRVRNKPGNIEQMAFIGVGGEIGGNTASASFLQRDRADSVGFRFGLTAQLLDSAVRATITPLNPIFGYRQWSVNEGNFLTYHFDKRIEADLRLEGTNDRQFFRITSVDYQNMPPGSVRLDIAGIELGEVFSLFPAPIPIEGVLSGNGAFGFSDEIIKGDLTLGINSLAYDGKIVGDVTTGVIANTNENNIWNLDFYLSANEQPAVTAWGTYDLGSTGALDMAVKIPGFTLPVLNAFLPDDIVQLEGVLHGELDIKGTLNTPTLTGGLNFENGRIAVPMIGTSFGITADSIRIGGNRVTFRDFGLIAPNNQRLALDGSLDMTDFSSPRANLRLFAANFQAVNSTRSGGSQVYGRADLDVNMTVRGALDALSIRGNVNILNTTDIYYTLRDSPLEVQDAKQDIVTFVSFDEEEYWAINDSIPLRAQSSVDMLVNVDIQDGVEATLNLSENGSNRIELQGDGALTMSVNSQGDTRLTGRYTLSGGTVVYSLPVVASVNFGIDDGSYVEWTGEMLNPGFNITATEVKSVRVVQNDASRAVTFNIIVRVGNTLENMELTFDLAAPADGDIQNELQSLAPEQRSTRALYMLIRNQYLSDIYQSEGNDFDVNQQLGNFISSEINQWARNNLSGVELSVGVDAVDDGTGGTHTDYSYSISKSLLNDRLKVTVGGSVSDNANAGSVANNLVEDISLEYRLAKRDNMFLKVYRYNTQESILEGEITESGAGFIVRKKMNKLRELFKLTPDPEKRQQRRDVRDVRQQLRDDERETMGRGPRPYRDGDSTRTRPPEGFMGRRRGDDSTRTQGPVNFERPQQADSTVIQRPQRPAPVRREESPELPRQDAAVMPTEPDNE